MPLVSAHKKSNSTSFYLMVTFSFIFLLTVIIVIVSDYYEFDKKFTIDVHTIKTNYDFYNNKNEIVLEGLSAFVASVGTVNESTLNNYAKDIQSRFPHIYGLEIAERIKKSDINKLIDRQKIKGYKNFSVRKFDYAGDRKWKKLSDRDEYLPLVYIYPLNKITIEILGLDINSHRYLDTSFEDAIKYGGYLASLPFTLIQGNKAFIMFKAVKPMNNIMPVYMSLIVITAKSLLDSLNEIDSSLSILLHHNSKDKTDISGHLISHNIHSDSILPSLSYSSSLDEGRPGFILHVTKQFQISDINWILLFLISQVLIALFFLVRGILMKNNEVRYKLQKAFQQKYKMEAISNLTAGIAHEFNNNLSVTQGFLSLLSEKNSDKEAKPWLKNIEIATEKSIDLTRKLLTYSCYKGFRKRGNNIFIVEEIDRMKVELSTAIPENIELNYNLADHSYSVLFSESSLKDIILELVTNASNAIGDDKGLITISTMKIYLTSSNDIGIDYDINVFEGDYILISVSDDGRGMNGEVKSRIFDPFFTTKSFGQSLGMGLANVYGLIKLANGYISSSSNKPKGCILNVYLPIYKLEK